MLIALGLCGIVLLAGLGACRQDPIRIGFAGPLTGVYSDLGVQGRNGAILAVEKINDRGGIHGRPLRLLPRDDGNTAAQAKAVDRELIQQGVVAIIGHMTSSQSVAALPVANRAEVVLLSPTTSTPRLSGKEDYFFRVQASTDRDARAVGRYARQSLQLHRVNTLEDTDNTAYTAPFVHNFTSAFAQNGSRVPERCAFSAQGAGNQTAALDCLRRNRPDGVLLATSARDAAGLLQGLRETDPECTAMVSGWAATRSLLIQGGAAVEGVYAAQRNFADPDNSRYQAFAQRYADRFGQSPSFAAVDSYDAVRVLARALETTQGKRRGLRRALCETEHFPSLYGKLSLDAYGDAVAPTHIFQVHNGALSLLQTIKPE